MPKTNDLTSFGDELTNGTVGKKFTDYIDQDMLIYAIGERIIPASGERPESRGIRSILTTFDAWNTKKGTADFTIHGETLVFSKMLVEKLDDNPFLVGTLLQKTGRNGNYYVLEPLPEDHVNIIRKNWELIALEIQKAAEEAEEAEAEYQALLDAAH